MSATKKPVSNDLVMPTFEYRLPDDFYTYPAGTPRRIEFVPQEIVHVELFMDPNAVGKGFIFTAVKKIKTIDYVSTTRTPLEQVEDYAMALHTPFPSPVFLDPRAEETTVIRSAPINPYDIDIDKQCFVVLQLNDQVNWCFRQNGVTTKQFYSDSSFGVVFVETQTSISRPGAPAPASRSRVLFFAVSERAHDTAYGFNFHIEFVWKMGFTGAEHAIPMIFDPNIPNGGGASIP